MPAVAFGMGPVPLLGGTEEMASPVPLRLLLLLALLLGRRVE